MEYTLSYTDKLNFLWNDFVEAIKDKVSNKELSKNFLQSIKKTSKKNINGFNSNASMAPNCKQCQKKCCENIIGRINLSLSDIAELMDNGLENAIEGDYKGFILMLDKYLETGDMSAFNIIDLSDNETSGIKFKPSIKKNDDLACYFYKNGKCSIYKNRPLSCRLFPHQYQHETKTLILDKNCESLRTFKSENESNNAIKSCINLENALNKDISLLMLHRDALDTIGFCKYL